MEQTESSNGTANIKRKCRKGHVVLVIKFFVFRRTSKELAHKQVCLRNKNDMKIHLISI